MPETRPISPDESFQGERITLRLVTLADCSERYLSWLNDPEVNRYLETRWSEQSLESIRRFVSEMLGSPDNYLFAIIERETGEHVGNIKLGPIHPRHLYADVSYFIGERSRWGRGYATDAIRTATRVGFERLELHRVQAGLYGANGASARALEKAGYSFEGRFSAQLRSGDTWDDHLWYGIVRDDSSGGVQ